MTNRECFELMVEYGGEKSITMVKEMIHMAGIEAAYQSMVAVYENNLKTPLKDEFKNFLRQGIAYISEQTNSN
jgi:putative IMPACT (imprinted ancient) family translation regulator